MSWLLHSSDGSLIPLIVKILLLVSHAAVPNIINRSFWEKTSWPSPIAHIGNQPSKSSTECISMALE